MLLTAGLVTAASAAAATGNERCVALHLYRKAQKCTQGRGSAHEIERLLIIEGSENCGKHDATDVAAGADEADDTASVPPTDIGDDAERTTLGALDHDGGENERENCSSQGPGKGEGNDEGTLDEQREELPPETTLHAVPGVVRVRS